MGGVRFLTARERSKTMLEGNGHNAPAAQEPEGTSDAQRQLSSRRTFLGGSAKLLGGGALALALGSSAALAQEGTTGVEAQSHNLPGDVKILNYALILERLEYEFYRRMLARFGERRIENADIFDGLGSRVRGQVHENLVRIRNHEKTHVDTLISVIKSLGGRPLPDSEYDFGVKSVADFVATAMVLENTGVKAYDGAIAYIHRRPLQTAGATIATVEARHAAYLNLLNGKVPFPSAFDDPKAPQAVCRLVDEGFITRSPYDLQAFCNSLPSTVIAP